MSTRDYCSVPFCPSKTREFPRKYFFRIPQDKNARRTWIIASRKDLRCVETSTSFIFCEDHFDLDKDVENLVECRLMDKTRLRLKKNVVPHKFACWEDRDENDFKDYSMSSKTYKALFKVPKPSEFRKGFPSRKTYKRKTCSPADPTTGILSRGKSDEVILNGFDNNDLLSQNCKLYCLQDNDNLPGENDQISIKDEPLSPVNDVEDDSLSTGNDQRPVNEESVSSVNDDLSIKEEPLSPEPNLLIATDDSILSKNNFVPFDNKALYQGTEVQPQQDISYEQELVQSNCQPIREKTIAELNSVQILDYPIIIDVQSLAADGKKIEDSFGYKLPVKLKERMLMQSDKSSQDKVRISDEQKQQMVEFLTSHSKLAKGPMVGLNGKQTYTGMWNELAEALNLVPRGAVKSGSKWQRGPVPSTSQQRPVSEGFEDNQTETAYSIGMTSFGEDSSLSQSEEEKQCTNANEGPSKRKRQRMTEGKYAEALNAHNSATKELVEAVKDLRDQIKQQNSIFTEMLNFMKANFQH